MSEFFWALFWGAIIIKCAKAGDAWLKERYLDWKAEREHERHMRRIEKRRRRFEE